MLTARRAREKTKRSKDMADNKYRMSRERLEELTKELEYLLNVRTKEVAEQIKEAAQADTFEQAFIRMVKGEAK